VNNRLRPSLPRPSRAPWAHVGPWGRGTGSWDPGTTSRL